MENVPSNKWSHENSPQHNTLYIYGYVITNKTEIMCFVTTAMSGHALPLQA